jgi:hypothetical protein
VDIIIQNVEKKIDNGVLNHVDLYDILDHIYVCVPSIGSIDSSIIKENDLIFLISKHNLHNEILDHLNEMKKSMTVSDLQDDHKEQISIPKPETEPDCPELKPLISKKKKKTATTTKC